MMDKIQKKPLPANDREPDFFEIDKNHLPEEWCNHPKHYYRRATKLADAREAWERAKAERDVIAADVEKSVRLTPSEFGIEKVTEAAVNAAVTLDKRHRDANHRVIQAKHAVDMAQAAVDTLDHRKHALENMVKLLLAEFFSVPKEPPEAAGKMRQAEYDNVFKKKSKITDNR